MQSLDKKYDYDPLSEITISSGELVMQDFKLEDIFRTIRFKITLLTNGNISPAQYQKEVNETYRAIGRVTDQLVKHTNREEQVREAQLLMKEAVESIDPDKSNDPTTARSLKNYIHKRGNSLREALSRHNKVVAELN